MAGKRAAAPASRPVGTYQRGGTRAVEEVRREQAHQRFVGRLKPEEREAYERGGQQAQRDEQRDQVRSAASRVTAPLAPVVDSGAGFVLGLLVWGWIVLPFLTGGATNVKNVLRAKFFNKAPDGSWLP